MPVGDRVTFRYESSAPHSGLLTAVGQGVQNGIDGGNTMPEAYVVLNEGNLVVERWLEVSPEEIAEVLADISA